MKRPERDENPEAEQQPREDEVLRVRRNRVFPDMLHELGNVERVGACLQIKGNQPDQRDQGPDAQIEGDLESSVVLLLSLPHTPIMINVGTSASSWKK